MRVGLRFDLRMYFVQLSSFPAGGSNSATSVPAALLGNTQRTQSCEPTGFGCVKTIHHEKLSGYDEQCRYQVIKAVMEGFDKMVEERRPANKCPTFMGRERKAQKQGDSTEVVV